jgi:C4-dicarboxylate-specific signal transduction histidine kinase
MGAGERVTIMVHYVHPGYTVKLGLGYLPPLVVFSLSALFVSWITARQQRAEQALRQVRDGLELTVQERTAALRRTNAELQAEISERQQAEEALRQTQAELVRVTRVMTMGELTASIAHEVNQPLAAVIANGQACLRWLARQTPNLEEVRAAVERSIREGKRASEVIQRIRALAQKTEPQKAWLAINDVIQEVIALVQGEVRKHKIALQTELSAALPPVLGDRVQLQQVLLNLVLNGIEAMHGVTDRPRELRIRSRRQDADAVLVAVQDAGSGLDPQSMARLFDPFFTTKPGGIGLGLSISRTIIEAHGGRLWATPNDGPGATVQFSLPTCGEPVS